MAQTKLKTGLAVLIIAGLATFLVIQHRAQIKLREENQSLRQQVSQLTTENERLAKHPSAPRLPAPSIHAAAQPKASPMEDLPSTNLYARFKDTAPKLT